MFAPDDLWRLARVAVLAAAAFAAVVVALRLGGKRTLSQLNAFDLVVTVAIGSTVATIALDSRTSLASGSVAIGALVIVQSVANYLTMRWPFARRLLRAEPTLLVHRGQILHDNMRSARIGPDELRQAARAKGHGSLDTVTAIVLETDGSLSVVVDAGSDAEGVLGPIRHQAR